MITCGDFVGGRISKRAGDRIGLGALSNMCLAQEASGCETLDEEPLSRTRCRKTKSMLRKSKHANLEIISQRFMMNLPILFTTSLRRFQRRDADQELLHRVL